MHAGSRPAAGTHPRNSHTRFSEGPGPFSPSRLLAIVVIGLLCAYPISIRASSGVLLSSADRAIALENAVRGADAVVVGTVLDTVFVDSPTGLFTMDGVILTQYAISVDSTLKGAHLSYRDIYDLGGTKGDRWFTAGRHRLEIDATYLLFINRCGDLDLTLYHEMTARCDDGSAVIRNPPATVSLSALADSIRQAAAPVDIGALADTCDAEVRARVSAVRPDGVSLWIEEVRNQAGGPEILPGEYIDVTRESIRLIPFGSYLPLPVIESGEYVLALLIYAGNQWILPAYPEAVALIDGSEAVFRSQSQLYCKDSTTVELVRRPAANAFDPSP